MCFKYCVHILLRKILCYFPHTQTHTHTIFKENIRSYADTRNYRYFSHTQYLVWRRWNIDDLFIVGDAFGINTINKLSLLFETIGLKLPLLSSLLIFKLEADCGGPGGKTMELLTLLILSPALRS